MEYDDGMDTQPGEQLSVGDHTIGQATYDIDGDGVADSYIMVSGSDQVEVLTDSNGDGQVDTVYEIDGDGSVTEMQPQDGHLVEVDTGHLDAHGRIAMDGTGTGHGGDGGDGTTGVGTTGDGTTGDGSTTTTADHTAGEVTMQDDGHTVDVGAPTVDLTGDGVKDTVVLQGTDGSTVLVADTDQNGQADNIAQINTDGSVVFAVPDGHGGWVVAGHGHVDASGTITQDQGGQTGQPYQPPVDIAQGEPSSTDPGTGGSTGSHTPDPGSAPGSTSGSGTGEDITVDINGKSYDVGEATLDADGNGSPDTAVVHGDDGTTILVTDVNGDGTGDQIVQVNPDGAAVIQQSDGHGGWQTVATGHMDANGNLVIDQQ